MQEISKKRNKVSKKIHKINCDHVVRQMTKEKKEYLELFLINKFIISYQIINSQITKEKKKKTYL